MAINFENLNNNFIINKIRDLFKVKLFTIRSETKNKEREREKREREKREREITNTRVSVRG